MATQGFEVPTEIRDFADKSVDQARNAFGNFLGSAAKTAHQLQNGSNTVQATLHTAVLKGLDHAQANATAAFDYAQRITRSRNLKEAFDIQSEFLKNQFASLQSQAKDYGSIAAKAKH